MKTLSKIYRVVFYALPAVMFLSYFPIISFGANETMNFEISIPIIVMVIFDLLSVFFIIKERRFKDFAKYKWWFLFPIWVTFTVIWSLNRTRGILTVGMMWMLFVAGYAVVEFRKTLLKDTWAVFRRVLYISGATAVVWCIVQCILDLVGVPRGNSLLCAGCVKEMFGFPHPSGFAIEPQFMGNLLLVPALICIYSLMNSRAPEALQKANTRLVLICKMGLAILFAFGIFLTFSRGAIYAFLVGVAIIVALQIMNTKSAKALVVIPIMIFAFLLALNTQGLMASASGLGETYNSGISKVINHLSLGVIKLDGGANDNGGNNLDGDAQTVQDKQDEQNEQNEQDKQDEQERQETNRPVYDGYVAESTDIRVRLTDNAIKVWNKKLNTIIVGVGVGGAGQAMYDSQMIASPKEIVQNEYASVLLETGIIGAILFAVVIVLAFVAVWKNPDTRFMVAILVAYGITLIFFSGYPNAMHIYFLPVAIAAVCPHAKTAKK